MLIMGFVKHDYALDAGVPERGVQPARGRHVYRSPAAQLEAVVDTGNRRV
jgi:hypothetical protein